MVPPGVDRWFCRPDFLGQGKLFQLSGQAEDLALQVCRLGPFEGGVHGDDRAFAHLGVFDGALVRGRRDVVVLDDLGSVALLGDQLLLGQQVVREEPVQLPDFVECGQFFRGVVAQVSDELADPGPVLVFHMGAVLFVVGPGAGERDLVLFAVPEEVVVDELTAVVRAKPNLA